MHSFETNGADISAGNAGPDYTVEIDPSIFAYTPRRLRVVCVGAGFSGLTLAYKIQHADRDLSFVDFTIYEKNEEVGGTWLENRYPGVACDIPAHSYIFSFEPNPSWSEFYAKGPEIKKYILDTADKHNLRENVVFNTELVKAHWDEEQGKWNLELNQNGTVVHDSADVLINGSGALNKQNWPKIDGIESFKGKLVHSAAWDPTYDWTGKKIAVIGNGSSALQIVPSTQPKAAKIVNYIRHPTWISPNLCPDTTKDGKGTNFTFTEEEIERFKNDYSEHYKYRKMIENSVNAVWSLMLLDSFENKMLTEAVKSFMHERLKGNPELMEKLMPDYPVGCRRLTPGIGYLEALQAENAKCCFSPIKRITEKGIVTDEGEEEFDLIVCATGFDTTFVPRWDMAGRDGRRLDVDWADVPEAYFSLCAAHMPNYFMFLGPNFPIGHGSVVYAMSWCADYMIDWIRKMATENIKSAAVKEPVVRAFNAYAHENLKRCVWSGSCHSWYKSSKGADHKVTAMYPGSALHFKASIETIRGEHFDIRYNNPANPFQYLANGELAFERSQDGDVSYYIT